MTTVTVPQGSWVAIVTTVGDTVFQNQSQRECYLTTQATGGLGLKEGFLLEPWKGVVITSAKSVSLLPLRFFI